MSRAAALPTRDALVATAGESLRRGSGSFAAAGADAAARIAHIRACTDAALAGQWVGDPAFDALRIVAREAAIPHALVHDVIEGFALDAAGWTPRHAADLMLYCYHVAGAVGCMMALVMGVQPDDADTLDRACDLGIAFQLANIARDVEADDRVGRCYLPDDWLTEMDIPPGQHMKPPFRHRLSVLVRRLVDCAALYEASARGGIPGLGLRSAWAVLAAAHIYGGIGRHVVAAGDHAWDHRQATNAGEKLAAIVRAGSEALRRKRLYGNVPRPAELWTRPRHQ